MEEEKYNPGRNRINQPDNDKVRPIKSRHKKTRNTKTRRAGEKRRRRERGGQRKREATRERLHPAQKVMLQLREIE